MGRMPSGDKNGQSVFNISSQYPYKNKNFKNGKSKPFNKSKVSKIGNPLLQDLLACGLCQHCGKSRCLAKPCPARSSTCEKCKKKGHRAEVCCSHGKSYHEKQDRGRSRSTSSKTRYSRRSRSLSGSRKNSKMRSRSFSPRKVQFRKKYNSFRQIGSEPTKSEASPLMQFSHLADALEEEENNVNRVYQTSQLFKNRKTGNMNKIKPGTASPLFSIKFGPFYRGKVDHQIVPFF